MFLSLVTSPSESSQTLLSAPLALPALALLPFCLHTGEVRDNSADDFVDEVFQSLPATIPPTAPQTPHILVGDLKAQLSGAIEIKRRIRSLLIKRPPAEASFPLRLLSASLLASKLFGSRYVVLSLNPFVQRNHYGVRTDSNPHTAADRLHRQATCVEPAGNAIQYCNHALDARGTNLHSA